VKQIKVQKIIAPTSKALSAIRRACPADPVALIKQIHSGAAELWDFNCGQLFIVTRFEVAGDSRELVLCAASGKGLFDLMPTLMGMANRMGVTGVRFHTLIPALGRKLKKIWICLYP